MKKITSLILLMFFTLVGYSQIISSGFETGFPAGWAIANNSNGIGQSWTVSNTALLANTGNSCLFVSPETASAAQPIQDWVITSTANLNGIINPKVSFYGKTTAPGPNRNSRLEVRVSTTNTDLASFTTTLAVYQDFNAGATNPISPVGGTYGFHELSLLQFAGQNVHIAFVMINEGFGKTWYLDDISVFEDCPDATDLAINNLTIDGGTASWVNPGGAPAFQVEVVPAAANPTGTPTYATTTTTTTQLITGLQPNTAYKYYVRSSCVNNVFGDWIGPFNFETNPLPVTLPYIEGFEGVHGWRYTNGTQINKWFVGTATQNGGAKALYISNDDGVSNIYTIGTNSITHAYRDVQIPVGTDEIIFSFDFKGQGQTTLDYMRFWSIPATAIPTSGTGITTTNIQGAIQVEGILNLTPNYTNKSYIINVAAYAGTTRRFVFEWRNNNNGGAQGPAAVDNVNIKAIACTAPTNLVLNSTTTNSATVSWTAPVTAPQSYQYFVSQTNTPPTETTVPTGTATGTSTTISGLQPGTTNFIWIRSNCGPNGTSFWIGYVIAQTNQIPATLPLNEGFEGTHNFQFSNNLQTNYWTVGTATHNGGAKSLYITDNGQANQYTITSASTVAAFRDFTIPANASEINIQFDFKGMGDGAADRMRVWLVPTTFVPVQGTAISVGNSGGMQLGLTNYSNVANWSTYNSVVNVTPFPPGTTRRLVFEWVNNASAGTQPPAAVDNVIVNAITCQAPTNIVLEFVNQNGATLTWPGNTNIQSYDYYVSTVNVPPTAQTTPTGTVNGALVTLSNLNPSTQYYFWVRSNCGAADGNSFWVGPIEFSTTQIPAALPYTEKFDAPNFVFGLSNGTQVNKWMVGTATAFSPTKSLYISNNNADNNYNITSASTVHAYRDLAMPAGITNYNLNFVYKGQGQSTSDYMKVWLVPVTYNLTPGTPITTGNSGGFQIGGLLNLVSTYQSYNFEFVLPANLTGQTLKLVFEWVNNASVGTQSPASVDNITFKVLTCPAPIDIVAGVTCEDATVASISWTPVGTETAWEYLVLPVNSPTPSAGTPVTQPEGLFPGLLPLTDYTVWVRAICGGTNGNSEWVSKQFTTAASPIAQANPFCAGPEGILFDNVYNDQNIPNLTNGNFHCLGSTPNPVWYYLQVDSAGVLNFQIVQNTQFNAQGQPTGNTLDVDYIAFGPFDSLNEACSDIIIAPGSPNSNTKIVGCSYSGAAVENFTITNGQPGQIYAILITNFNGSQGKIKLVQTNAGQPGAGTTDCDFLCEVDLGPDLVICGNEYVIDAQISTVGIGNVTSVEWYYEGDLMDPNIYNTLSITVNQSGVYSVIIEKENCSAEEPITDEVNIVFVSPFSEAIPESITVCDIDNDNQEFFDLQAFTDSFINGQSGYTVTYHLDLTDANAGFGQLTTPYLSSPGTIYVRVSSNNLPSCARIEPIELILKETILPIVEFEYSTPICVNGQSNISPILVEDFTMGGVFSSTSGLDIDPVTGEIDLDSSLPGIYDVEYFYTVDPEFCGDSDSFVYQIQILNRIGFMVDGYCKDGQFTITATDILGTLDFATATFEWSDNVTSSDKSTAIVNKEGTYILTVTTADGCIETSEITVTDIYCQVPKGISPNGDGLNDNFDLTNLKVQKVQIFNRYGQEVYSHGLGYTNQWYGQSNNGGLLPSGTYFYTIVSPFETFTGWIQVTREIN